ncbi:MAG: glycine cleavage T C-terminal barrel domain-containing protein, partial [Rhizobiaceae bacterium]
ANNPYELGMERLVDLDMEADFVSKKALTRIKEQGASQLLVGLEIDGDLFVGFIDFFWPVLKDGKHVGIVTSAIYSPRLEKNIALAMISIDHTALDTTLQVDKLSEKRACTVVPMPFYDP